MTPYNLKDIPPDIASKTIREIENSWGKGMAYEAPTLDIAKDKVMEMTGYSFKMYLQGRTDKINQDKMEVFKWAIVNLLPEETLKAHPFELHSDFKFKDMDHAELTSTVLNKVWDLYAATPDLVMPANPAPKSKKFSFLNFFK